jgi:hypothetical protein
MNAEILDAQVVIVVVLHVGEAALRIKIRLLALRQRETLRVATSAPRLVC